MPQRPILISKASIICSFARLFIYHREQLEAKEAESEILVQPAEDGFKDLGRGFLV